MPRVPLSKEPWLLALGKAVRAFRCERQITQEALGQRSGLHPTWISRLESGRVNPTWGNVRRVSMALGVPLADLAVRADELEREMQPKSPSGEWTFVRP
jgi:transcriptional regulator with XRE-family HTH domain